jgi:catechol 2,3-dioxygenase-like lactoylglutathione lyase family enzyme
MDLEALDHVGLTVTDVAPPPPADPLRHVAFRTSRRGLEAAKAELRARGIAFEERDYDVAWSVYMPDPDGHLVEITTYEVHRG